ncbi:MAG: SAM-dependent methyltransferase [Halioglobus sp.]|jgi:SAM-dependent methyltransferase
MPQFSHCPLCGGFESLPFYSDKRRTFERCQTCLLVHVSPRYYLDSSAERAEYDKHQNFVQDLGYRKFLSRLADPLLKRLAARAHGLDFGCGPGPALADLLTKAGCTVDLYDVFYEPDQTVLEKYYDFICATEVAEHLHRPGAVFDQLWDLLLPGGYLGLMTKLVRDETAFARWHYKNDPTHVCFFSRETFQWWAVKRGAQIEFIGADVIILKK